MQKSDDDNEVLPPARATAQARREREFLALLGVPRESERQRIRQEIHELGRIIESDRGAVALKSVNAADRKLLKKQILRRTAQLEDLKQRLEGLED
jgi:hypothetical protein